MKLRNKKTGEIAELHFEPDKEYHFTVVTDDPADMMTYKTLAGLNEEWEDYEEKSWYITENGEVRENSSLVVVEEESEYREIGNYFETKEEAEKAVEKLKAWKRLKDKGFEFEGINEADGSIKTGLSKGVSLNNAEEFYRDMALLFGGKE